MTLHALQAFISSAADDEQLRQKLEAASGLNDVVDLARSHGHQFSKATLLKAHAEVIDKAPDQKRSDSPGLRMQAGHESPTAHELR